MMRTGHGLRIDGVDGVLGGGEGLVELLDGLLTGHRVAVPHQGRHVHVQAPHQLSRAAAT